VVEDIQRAGTPLQAFKFTPQSKQQLMQRLAVVIQQGLLKIPLGVIIGELNAFGYEYTAHGVRYSAPDGLHDDCVMALALAVYGRDQMWVPAEAPSDGADENTFVGWDFQHQQRKKRGYEHEPVERTGWRPERFTTVPSRGNDD
jgi:hypothetical protein